MIGADIELKEKKTTSNLKSLKEIRRPIESDLKEFQAYYKKALKTDVFLLNQIINYLLKMKGKEMRPILVLLSARLCGKVDQSTFTAATMIELLHTATLIHDDVVDEADQRRGFFSINKIWKNKASVLLGDYLLSKGLLVALDNDEFALLKVLSNAVKRMSEGELRQLKASKLLNMTEERYFKIISEKTASLLSACCKCGAISATDDVEKHRLLEEIGEHLGLAFQIKDDLFDYGADDIGKPTGNDIKERKITLPMIAALERSGVMERRKLIKLFGKRGKTQKQVNEIIRLVNGKGGLDYARTHMNLHTQKARDLLHQFPESDERQSMLDFIDFVITRKK
ncbi:MAG: polyprenyl synthetase family protein [Balneolales bacterium]